MKPNDIVARARLDELINEVGNTAFACGEIDHDVGFQNKTAAKAIQAKKDLKQYLADAYDRLQAENEKLLEALEEIIEYNNMIPLNTEDSHVIHYYEQIKAWADKAAGQYQKDAEVGDVR